jgi:sporulation protein YlmC with PRC-barrel domain
MSDQGTLIWNGTQIGKVSNVMFDMWYAEADWESYNNSGINDFEKIAMGLNGAVIMKDFSKGIVAFIMWNDNKECIDTFLILSLSDGRIFMRLVSDEVAGFIDRKMLVPWDKVEEGNHFDKELKQELSFFHQLRWRRFKAVGKRQDRDEVLFEIKSGRNKYFVVHLTYRKEKSIDYPRACFYRDWNDVYTSLILIDHKQWLGNE